MHEFNIQSYVLILAARFARISYFYALVYEELFQSILTLEAGFSLVTFLVALMFDEQSNCGFMSTFEK